MTNIQIQELQKLAFQYSEINAELNYLHELIKEGKLNSEQEDYVSGYSNHIGERIENLEYNLFEVDEDGTFYKEVREASNMLKVEPSEWFLGSLQSQLNTMNLDGIDFQIKKAVDQFNSFYYSCAIYLTGNGYVAFNGCGMESGEATKVLFNKSDKRNLTIEDVKQKIAEVNDTLIKDTTLSIRSSNCLRRHGIDTVSQLARMTDDELTSVRNLGYTSVCEVKDFLRNFNN